MIVLHSETTDDRKLCEEVLNHLRPLDRRAGIELWAPGQLRAGDEVRQGREQAIARASMIVLLLSPDFLASDLLQDVELPMVRERYQLAEVSVVPIVIRSCAWEDDLWLTELRTLPSDGRPIASLPRLGDERDHVLANLARELVLLAAERMSASPTEISPADTASGAMEAPADRLTRVQTADTNPTFDDFAARIANDLQVGFSKAFCPEHQEAVRVIVLGCGDWSRLSVECCCGPFAGQVRLALVHASGAFNFHIAVRSRDGATSHTGAIPTNAAIRWSLEDVLQSSKVRWAGLKNTVEIVETDWYGTSLLRVRYRDEDGDEQTDYLDRASEQSIDVAQRGPFVYSLGRHPTEVPRLFTDRESLWRVLRELHAKRKSHALVNAFINEVAWRLSAPSRPLGAVRALDLAKRSVTWPAQEDEIIWEIFDTTPFDEALRRLERDQDPRRLKIAICLDPNVDALVFRAFERKARASIVRMKLRASELMLVELFRRTTVRIARELDRLVDREVPDRLEFTDFGLEPGQPCWSTIHDLPYGYSGLGLTGKGHLSDPIFFLDVLNVGTRESRIYSAYIDVRFRQIKPHGFAEPRLLRPITTIELPLNNGEQNYAEVLLREPVLVPPGTHARIRIRLDNAGFCWRGVVDIGLIYGDGNALRVPALSIIL